MAITQQMLTNAASATTATTTTRRTPVWAATCQITMLRQILITSKHNSRPIVNNVTMKPGVGITDTVWSANWIPLVPGTYTVTGTMTDTLGNSLMDTVQVTVVENTPTAITLVHIGVVPISTPMMFLLLIMLFALFALVVVGSQRRYWPNGQL